MGRAAGWMKKSSGRSDAVIGCAIASTRGRAAVLKADCHRNDQ